MSEEDFVYAWLLAAKSGVGTAVAWQASTMEHQLREAKCVYQYVQQEQRKGESKTGGHKYHDMHMLSCNTTKTGNDKDCNCHDWQNA